MDSSRLQYLFERYFEKTAGPEERDELSGLLGDDANREEVMQLFNDAWEKYQGDGQIVSEERSGEILEHILRSNAPVIKMHPERRLLRRWIAAASIILLVGLGGYFAFHTKAPGKPPIAVTKEVKDVQAPKVARAVITLSSGQHVFLDSASNGTLATQGNVAVIKNEQGIVYSSQSSSPDGEAGVRFNVLTNPRGSKVVTLTLSDGTKVWLNNESSLRYPTAFTGKERKVEITGEAYFEVAHNASMPFKVSKDGVEVQVLGTHFNVNSYTDEKDIKVTLLEGLVKVKSGERSGLLKPGQQAQVGMDIKIESKVNLESVMAWKNGLFQFDKASIQSIMRQVERWYDVEVVYNGNMQAKDFGGAVSRTENVSQVLKMLEATGAIHFKIEGRKITVLP